MKGLSCRSEAQQRQQRSVLSPAHAECKFATTAPRRCLMPFTKHRRILPIDLGSGLHAQRFCCQGRRGIVTRPGQKSANGTANQAEGTQKTLSVRIRTKHSVRYGEVIRTVGAGDALGDWDANQAPGMTWGEGDEWSVDLQVPPGIYDFKCVVTRSDGSIAAWEPGENRTFRVPDPEDLPGQVLEVVCPWSNTAATFMSFDEDDATERLEDSHTGIEISNSDRTGENPAASLLTDEGEGLSRLQGDSSSSTQEVEQKVDTVAKAVDRPSNGSSASLQASTNGKGKPVEASLSKQLEQSKARTDNDSNGSVKASAPLKGQIEKDTKIDANLAIASSETDRTSEARKPELRGVQETSDVSPPSTSKQEEPPATFTQGFLGLLGLLSVPIVLLSEITLKQTGCGLPPGPSGYLGALEGVSYLTVGALALWGASSKLSRGRGLPKGPGGVLGAAEGLSYAVILLGTLVLGSQYKEYGYIPSALPDSKCFGEDASTSRSSRSFASFAFPSPQGGEGDSVGEKLSSTLETFKGIFMSGPESSREYSSSGAEDGLSSAELEPVVEELENAAARFGEFLNSLRQSLTPTPARLGMQDRSLLTNIEFKGEERRWDVVADPATVAALFGKSKTSNSPVTTSPSTRLVGMEMSFNLAATTATSASNNVTHGLNEHVLQLKDAADNLAETAQELTEAVDVKLEQSDPSPQAATSNRQETVQDVEENILKSPSLRAVAQQLKESAEYLRNDSDKQDVAQKLDQASDIVSKALDVKLSADNPVAATSNNKAPSGSTDQLGSSQSGTNSAGSDVLSVKVYLEEAAEVLSSLASQDHGRIDDQGQLPE